MLRVTTQVRALHAKEKDTAMQEVDPNDALGFLFADDKLQAHTVRPDEEHTP